VQVRAVVAEAAVAAPPVVAHDLEALLRRLAARLAIYGRRCAACADFHRVLTNDAVDVRTLGARLLGRPIVSLVLVRRALARRALAAAVIGRRVRIVERLGVLRRRRRPVDPCPLSRRLVPPPLLLSRALLRRPHLTARAPPSVPPTVAAAEPSPAAPAPARVGLPPAPAPAARAVALARGRFEACCDALGAGALLRWEWTSAGAGGGGGRGWRASVSAAVRD